MNITPPATSFDTKPKNSASKLNGTDIQREPPVEYLGYTEPQGTKYVYSSFEFWTSGFFPGCLYALYQRQRKYPAYFPEAADGKPQIHPLKLQCACKWWTSNLHSQASRKDTHDLGFMIQPWAQICWGIDRDPGCLSSLVTAAHMLGGRWDTCRTKRYSFDNPKKDFLVIIDNMCNLDLLYYVTEMTSEPKLANIATTHALTTLASHIRPDFSTYHVVNFDQNSSCPGVIKERLTSRGYSDNSCWSRGQAWAILGYTQCYRRTKYYLFLETAQHLAEYFISHLSADRVPDTSAALIAAYGMLLRHEARPGDSTLINYMREALISDKVGEKDVQVDMGSGAGAIILNATINNFEFAPRRCADHGLVYADYFFLLIGNKLIEMGVFG
ncbi:glycoside hydrolase family 88 protein [Zopfia rhizophila CBS 207.26]|uniref:Glycoside hydrolase family 88 protein n=1 Tax=Zopfia rhizophila CBS 207.26 TaxID=1314779 RepID=A0A6A6DWT6_9PEZI|nr:glycoside hydrolase family 88 protein [Zopfia rhizophila CBS 207.26]